MIDIKKTSETLNENYNYADDEVMGNLVLVKNEDGGVVSMNGQVYAKKPDGTQGAYIGNFNGQMQDGVMRYSTSSMTRQQYELVMDLIDELEKKLFPTE